MSQTTPIDQIRSRYDGKSILQVMQIGRRILKQPDFPTITEYQLARLDKVRPPRHDLCS